MRIYNGAITDPVDFRVAYLGTRLDARGVPYEQLFNGCTKYRGTYYPQFKGVTVDERNAYEVQNVINNSANVLEVDSLYLSERPAAPREFLLWVGTRLQLLNDQLAEAGLPYFASTIVHKSRVKSALSLVGIDGSPLYIESENDLLSTLLSIDSSHVSFLQKSSAAALSNLGFKGKPLIKAQCEYVRMMAADSVTISQDILERLRVRFERLSDLRAEMQSPDLLLSSVLFTWPTNVEDRGWYSTDIHPTVCAVSDFDIIVNLRYEVSRDSILSALECVPTPISLMSNGVSIGFTSHGFQLPAKLGEPRDCRVLVVRDSLHESIDASVEASWESFVKLTGQKAQHALDMRYAGIIQRVAKTFAGYPRAGLSGTAVRHDFTTNFVQVPFPPSLTILSCDNDASELAEACIKDVLTCYNHSVIDCVLAKYPELLKTMTPIDPSLPRYSAVVDVCPLEHIQILEIARLAKATPGLRIEKGRLIVQKVTLPLLSTAELYHLMPQLIERSKLIDKQDYQSLPSPGVVEYLLTGNMERINCDRILLKELQNDEVRLSDGGDRLIYALRFTGITTRFWMDAGRTLDETRSYARELQSNWTSIQAHVMGCRGCIIVQTELHKPSDTKILLKTTWPGLKSRKQLIVSHPVTALDAIRQWHNVIASTIQFIQAFTAHTGRGEPISTPILGCTDIPVDLLSSMGETFSPDKVNRYVERMSEFKDVPQAYEISPRTVAWQYFIEQTNYFKTWPLDTLPLDAVLTILSHLSVSHVYWAPSVVQRAFILTNNRAGCMRAIIDLAPTVEAYLRNMFEARGGYFRGYNRDAHLMKLGGKEKLRKRLYELAPSKTWEDFRDAYYYI